MIALGLRWVQVGLALLDPPDCQVGLGGSEIRVARDHSHNPIFIGLSWNPSGGSRPTSNPRPTSSGQVGQVGLALFRGQSPSTTTLQWKGWRAEPLAQNE